MMTFNWFSVQEKEKKKELRKDLSNLINLDDVYNCIYVSFITERVFIFEDETRKVIVGDMSLNQFKQIIKNFNEKKELRLIM